MTQFLELWAVMRVVPPPPSPLVLGKMDVNGKPLPCGVALFTSRAKAEAILSHTLMVPVMHHSAFKAVKLGMGRGELQPQQYIGFVMNNFMMKATLAGLDMSKAVALLSMAFGVYIDPKEPKDALGPPTKPNLYQFLGGYFPKEIASMETTGLKFYAFRGYQVLVENLKGTWLVAAKKGKFENVDEFRVNMAKDGQAFYGTFETAEKSVEEAELWIDGTQSIAELLSPNGKS